MQKIANLYCKMKKDIIVILVLVALILVFWLPALFNWLPLFGDDFTYHHLPSKVLYARSLQRGELPWWDPHTFCGAWPVIHRLDGGPYYLPDYPFLFLADISDLSRSPMILVFVPLLIHYIWIIVSCYLLGRMGFKFNRTGSAVFSIAYAMSPAVNYLAFSASIVPLYSWLPAICLCLMVFTRTGRLRYIAFGGAALALQMSCGAPGHLARIYTMIIFLFLIWGIKLGAGKRWKELIRMIAGGGTIALLGVLLAAPAWLGLLEGYRNLVSAGVVDFDRVAGGLYSLRPGYLSTLLVPNLFGSWTGKLDWGLSRSVLFDQSNLLGGMLVLLLVLAGIIIAFRAAGRPERFWVFLSLSGVILGILIVLGRYTPVFRWLYSIFPPFRSPYAVRWRDFESFYMAILAGGSVSLLASFSPSEKPIGRAIIWSYAVFAIGIIALVCLVPVRFRGVLYSPGIRQAVESGVIHHLLRTVIPYLAGCLLLFILMTIKSGYRSKLLIAAVIAELILWGWLALYLHKDWYGYDPLITKHYRYEDTKMMNVVDLDPFRTGAEVEAPGYRAAFYRSRLANSSWLLGGLSLFGYDCKPVLPRFRKALSRIGPGGFVYEMVITRWDSRFPANMGSARAVVEREQVRENARDPDISDIVVPVVETDGPEARLADDPVMVSIPAPLPRFYTQDILISCTEEEALKELMEGDLRKGVFIEDSEQLAVSGKQLSVNRYQEFLDAGDNQKAVEHFNELQEDNRIIDLDTENPNRVKAMVEITRPAMLVMTDVWHPDWRVTVNGERAELLRVNYLQRGVWLPEGKNEVVLRFVPASWKLGRWLSLAGLLVLLILLVADRKNRN